MPFREVVAPQALAGQLRYEVVDRAEDQQTDVEQRHVVEVSDDPHRVVDDHVGGDRRVDDAREPGEEPRDHPQEQRGRRSGPLEVAAQYGHPEAVERERRGYDQGERDGLHERVDQALMRVLGVVQVDVMGPDQDVGDDGDRPPQPG